MTKREKGIVNWSCSSDARMCEYAYTTYTVGKKARPATAALPLKIRDAKKSRLGLKEGSTGTRRFIQIALMLFHVTV